MGKLINSARRGAPFVANLRIQWINLVRAANPTPPVTIQLLGDIDDIVSEEDNVDVQSGVNFIYRRVATTGHANVICFAGPEGKSRRENFLYALKTPLEGLRSDSIAPLEPDRDIQQVVFVMHGIRDYGHWTKKLGNSIEKIAVAQRKKVRVITSGYDYFPMMGFLLQPERQKNVRWFMDQYTEALARYPRATISYIGHSNGSYLLASALDRYHTCVFDRVVFAGSVVYRTFPWDEMVNRKGSLRSRITLPRATGLSASFRRCSNTFLALTSVAPDTTVSPTMRASATKSPLLKADTTPPSNQKISRRLLVLFLGMTGRSRLPLLWRTGNQDS